jgi:hypothetical protein
MVKENAPQNCQNMMATMSQKDFTRLREFIYSECGITLELFLRVAS